MGNNKILVRPRQQNSQDTSVCVQETNVATAAERNIPEIVPCKRAQCHNCQQKGHYSAMCHQRDI